MAGRESYAISNYWKYPRYNRFRNNREYPSFHLLPKRQQFVLRIKSVWYFIWKKFVRGYKWDRKMFILDNIEIPYNKILGCRLRGKHDWFYADDEMYAFCTKCHKRSPEMTREQFDRSLKLKQKINKIKKGIK